MKPPTNAECKGRPKDDCRGGEQTRGSRRREFPPRLYPGTREPHVRARLDLRDGAHR